MTCPTRGARACLIGHLRALSVNMQSAAPLQATPVKAVKAPQQTWRWRPMLHMPVGQTVPGRVLQPHAPVLAKTIATPTPAPAPPPPPPVPPAAKPIAQPTAAYPMALLGTSAWQSPVPLASLIRATPPTRTPHWPAWRPPMVTLKRQEASLSTSGNLGTLTAKLDLRCPHCRMCLGSDKVKAEHMRHCGSVRSKVKPAPKLQQIRKPAPLPAAAPPTPSVTLDEAELRKAAKRCGHVKPNGVRLSVWRKLVESVRAEAAMAAVNKNKGYRKKLDSSWARA